MEYRTVLRGQYLNCIMLQAGAFLWKRKGMSSGLAKANGSQNAVPEPEAEYQHHRETHSTSEFLGHSGHLSQKPRLGPAICFNKIPDFKACSSLTITSLRKDIGKRGMKESKGDQWQQGSPGVCRGPCVFKGRYAWTLTTPTSSQKQLKKSGARWNLRSEAQKRTRLERNWVANWV